jgi:uncharacterized protein YndB with AHSA1/START domain
MEKMQTITLVKGGLTEVWDCFTMPAHIVGWNFASEDWYCPTAKNDLKPGGRFSYRMASVDGCMGFDFEGTFTDIQTGKLLKYKLDDGREVEVHFNEKESGTEIVQRFEPEQINDLDLQQKGWQAILDNFKKYTEGKIDSTL